jgi:hypothetical protein
MKRIPLYILFVGVLLTLSCNDGFLDVKPVDRITETDVFGSKEAIISHLGRLYWRCPMEDFSWPAEFAGFTLHTDEMVNCTQDQNGYDPGNYQWWGDGYIAIRYINNFIHQISQSTVFTNVKERDDILGQAYWLRAYTYMALARRYGGVPILTEVPELPDDPTELYIARSTEEEVFDQILSDLDFAIENLSETPSAYIINKGTALAFKSRVMLYGASLAKYSSKVYEGGTYMDGLLGIPESKAAEYYKAAMNAAKQVIESGKYELYDYSGPTYQNKVENYEKLFFDETSKNKERILVRAYLYPERTHLFDERVVPFSFRAGTGWSSRRCPPLYMVEKYEYVNNRDGSLQVDGKRLSTNDPILVDDIRSLFKNKDPRFVHNILTPGSPWYNDTVRVFVNTIEGGKLTGQFGKDGIAQPEATSTGFYFAKWLQRKPARPINEGSEVDWPIIRYAEVLLDYAEANFELAEMGAGGDKNEALKYVNLIRERAGIQLLDEITMEDIRNERLFEFYGEGQRYWDLKRWRIFHELLDNTETFAIWPTLDKDINKYSIVKYQLPSDKFKKTFQPRNYYMQIPQDEIEKNPLLKQNFGY